MSDPNSTIGSAASGMEAALAHHAPYRAERVRWLLSVTALALLVAGLYLVFEPFLVPLTWAAILVLTTWPLHKRALLLFPRRPVFAAAAMTGFLALVLVAAVGPLVAALSGEAQSFARSVADWAQSDQLTVPESLLRIPLLGRKLEHFFTHESDRSELLALVKEYQGALFQIASVAARGILEGVVKVVMCLFAAFFIYLHGANLARQITTATTRLGGERFGRILAAVRGAVRGAVYGVVATALAQGTLSGLGYWVSGAPTPLLLGFATTVMSLIPFGTPLVYIPAAGYLIAQGSTLAGILLLAWGIGVVSMVDNIVRPFFISQATQMPILLVFIGVVGGVFNFGLLGIFLGPAIIAVAEVLWFEWIDRDFSGTRPAAAN